MGRCVIENEFYSQDQHGPFETFNVGDLMLERRGTLSDTKDNAILVTTWFAGTSKTMEQAYIGPGRALDPAKYFIVVVNQIGGGLSTSPHNTPFPLGMANFPMVTIGDDVVAQERLLRAKYGIDTLALVVGGSMGAQQVYEWAVRFPDKVLRAAPLAGTAKTTPHNGLFVSTLTEAITSDPAWNAGWYDQAHSVREGLRRHARQWELMGLSPGFLKAEGWRAAGFSSLDDFALNFLLAAFLPADPNDLACMARKWQDADVSRHAAGDLAAALHRIRARTTVMPISSDMFFVPADCAAGQALTPNSQLAVLDTAWGHIGLFGLDPEYPGQVDVALGELLDHAP